MAPKGLSKNQRWLLFHIGGWRIVDALAVPTRAEQLLELTCGSTSGQSSPEAPHWLGGWDISHGVIRSRNHAGPRVEITAPQLTRYIAQLPDTITSELAAASSANTANTEERERFCFCRQNPCHNCDRHGYIHNPDPEQVQAVAAEGERVRSWGVDILRRALHLGGEQLGLFEVAS